MSLITCADADVMRGRIIVPEFGTWVADLVIDAATAPSGVVTIASDGGLSLSGYVLPDRVGVHLDTCYLRIVGGKGGLSKDVSGAYQFAQLRDPLGAIMSTTGEALSSSVGQDLLSLSLARWTLGRCRASRALDDLAAAAGLALGADVRWRVLSDGTVWIGSESWPAAKFPATDTIANEFPNERRFELAVATLSLMPGVELEDVGQVGAVEHWIEPDALRTWAWLA